jgi:hypothetical protein
MCLSNHSIICSGCRFDRLLVEAEFGKADLHAGIDDALALLQQDVREGIRIVKEYGDIPQITCFPGELNQQLAGSRASLAETCQKSGCHKPARPV